MGSPSAAAVCVSMKQKIAAAAVVVDSVGQAAGADRVRQIAGKLTQSIQGAREIERPSYISA